MKPAEFSRDAESSERSADAKPERGMPESMDELAAIAAKLRIGAFHRHVFLCVGEACCTAATGQAAWEALKKELKDRNLSLADGPAACYRTKVGCLRVCGGGPVMVVYPEGTWYAGMTADRVPRFVREHLIEGRPVAEWVFAKNPLPRTGEPGA